ncbi:hypothetical protein [Ahrensia kielensis]|uniref:hypothetical protein n=1 Tax=Ahrensia kielensis TaxID=76980 RepID=UPI0012EA642A|nr:hypothetical protein [Ahrensia kielensis]
METQQDQDQPVLTSVGKAQQQQKTTTIQANSRAKAANDHPAIKDTQNTSSEDGYPETSFNQTATIRNKPHNKKKPEAEKRTMQRKQARVTTEERTDNENPQRTHTTDEDEERKTFDSQPNSKKKKTTTTKKKKQNNQRPSNCINLKTTDYEHGALETRMHTNNATANAALEAA